MNGRNSLEVAARYHDALPLRIREYLNRRGITDPVVDLHLLGWNGERITIPVWDRRGELAYFRLAKDPEEVSSVPKMLSPGGAPAELYGWERLNAKPLRIVISEGEFDRLVLETQGIAAVTSTAGAGVFRPEWAAAFDPIPEVYICFDRDEAGRRGAARVARVIPHARIVELPAEVGDGGDVTDYFVRLKRSRTDFLGLLRAARPGAPRDALKPPVSDRGRSQSFGGRDVDELKASVPIENVVGRYVKLRRSGVTLVAHCPFHADRSPSFTVYPDTRTFYCFGCQTHGDVVSFLVKVENLTFPEALKVLRRLVA